MENHLKFATALATLLDSRFKIGKIRFGLDPIFDAVPVLGSLVSLILSLYLVWIGVRMDLPDHEIGRMIKNIVYNFLIGSIPLVGEIGSIFYKSNIKNLNILKNYSGKIMV